MSKVIAGFSMSLDGFVADRDDGVEHVFKWYSAEGTDAEVMVGDHATGMTREAAEFIEEAGRAPASGHRAADLRHRTCVGRQAPHGRAYGRPDPQGPPAMGEPRRIALHVRHRGSPEGHRRSPGDRGRQGRRGRCSRVTQQCLHLGLLDAIHIAIAPVVLGRGIRLFDHLTKPVELLVTEASGNPHVTHITYRVIK